ncbi:MAG: tRNA (guanosine(37)-N1)-methyltransferase TrmD [Gammaproteobacteria bacterium]
MHIQIITLFPEMVMNLSKYGVVGRAIENNLVTLKTYNPRDFSTDRHRSVDDRPYGGGPGMVMQYEPLQKAIRSAIQNSENCNVVCLSAQGKPFQQADVDRLGAYSNLVLVAGRYEGIDERLMESEIDEEISMGDFVVSGGELPAMLMVDALVRHIPGALGHEESALRDSFVDGLLDCPHYTRPESIDGRVVPDILLQGNHQAIERWRKKESLGRTYLRRPDLIAKLNLSDEQKALLEEYLKEQPN